VKAGRGTPFDFTTAKVIGKDIEATGGNPVGYDHNYVINGNPHEYVINGNPHELRPVAKLKDRTSGRVLTIDADQPGLFFYTGNRMGGSFREKGTTYDRYSMLCLETAKIPEFDQRAGLRNDVILRPGETYKHTMVEKFTNE
jgi:aldose 1-epimerase